MFRQDGGVHLSRVLLMRKTCTCNALECVFLPSHASESVHLSANQSSACPSILPLP